LATTPDDNSEAFLREVDENLRRDQAQAMAKRFGPLIIGAILLLLAAIGGWMYWQDRQAKAAAADSEVLSAAMNDIAARKPAAAAPKLDQLTHSSSSGIATEAKLTQAAEAIEVNNRPAAIAIYRAIAADGSVAQPFRDIATVRLAAMEFDSAKPEDIITRLAPLAKPGGAFFGSAGELTGMAMIKLGRTSEAGKMFAAIAADKNVPESIRSRAVPMAGTLGVDATASLPALSR
jgi:hypothetical protein